MIPVRDNNPRQITPWVNYSLIAANILVFLWQLTLGPELAATIQRVAFVPARFWSPATMPSEVVNLFVSMFMHGGLLHIGSNMLYLWIFGDNLEDRMGHVRYLLFYLFCGVLATLAHAVSAPSSAIPALGASGAIAGVLGGYLLLFPHARVMTFIPFGFFIALRELPAIFVLGIWFVLQLFTGIADLGVASDQGGVAYFAHIGGFLAGLLLVRLFARAETSPRNREWRRSRR
jgi:membrane associated rhomboid family serine protease